MTFSFILIDHQQLSILYYTMLKHQTVWYIINDIFYAIYLKLYACYACIELSRKWGNKIFYQGYFDELLTNLILTDPLSVARGEAEHQEDLECEID